MQYIVFRVSQLHLQQLDKHNLALTESQIRYI